MRRDRLLRTLADLARCSEDNGPGVTRFSWSGADRQARKYLESELLALGLSPWTDGIGNLHALKKGTGNQPRVVIGSHLDTVRNGGRLDGAYGVAAALEVLRSLSETGSVHERDLEFIAFAEEEGSNFGSTCLGSKVLAGLTGPEDLAVLTRPDGKSAVDVLREFGLLPESLSEQRIAPGSVAAFLEVHIEQNGRLEAEGIRLGLVEAVSAMRLFRVTVTGVSDHAASPMAGRRDPVAGLGALLTGLEGMRASGQLPEELAWTVGSIACEPDMGIVIPAQVVFTVDIRHPDPDVLDRSWTEIAALIRKLAAFRGLKTEIAPLSASGGARMDTGVLDVLERAAEARNCRCLRMLSGPAHDAACMAAVAPAGLLFVPSVGGRSHCPEEDTCPEDLVLGAAVLEDAVRSLAGVVVRLDSPGVDC